jgi:hypothetical protein
MTGMGNGAPEGFERLNPIRSLVMKRALPVRPIASFCCSPPLSVQAGVSSRLAISGNSSNMA